MNFSTRGNLASGIDAAGVGAGVYVLLGEAVLEKVGERRFYARHGANGRAGITGKGPGGGERTRGALVKVGVIFGHHVPGLMGVWALRRWKGGTRDRKRRIWCLGFPRAEKE